MSALTKNTALVTLAALLCLSGLAAPVKAEDTRQDPTRTADQPVFAPPLSSTEASPRTDESGQRERSSSRNHDEDMANDRSDGRDGQTGFEDRQREQGRGFRAEADRISHGGLPEGRTMTNMNPQEDMAPSDDAPRPGPPPTRWDAGDERPRGEREPREQGEPAPGPREGIAPPDDAPRPDPLRQEGTLTTSAGKENSAERREELRTGGESHLHDDDRHRRRGDDGDRDHRGGWSHDDDRKRSDFRRDDGRHEHRRVKRVIHHIPPRHAVIVHGRDRYHYHAGRYYRPWEGGFILVRPPLGLIVFDIPLGSRMFISAGVTYHVFGDVFYRRVPAGYEVVEFIRDRAAHWPERVTVITDLLNVRYGPYENEEVIAQVERFTVLNVLGSAPGWLYVEIEDEDVRGWVMEHYVRAGAGRG